MEKDIFRRFVKELISEAKDVFLNEFRNVVMEVLEAENILTGRDENFLMQRLTYVEISEQYRVSLTSLKKWKKEGLLVSTCKGGKTLLFERRNVENCLRNRKRIVPSFKQVA